MAAERVSLDVLVREERGSAAARRMRREGLVPGVVYGGNAEPTAILGIARVVANGYPDHTAQDPRSPYHDPAHDPGAPRWYWRVTSSDCSTSSAAWSSNWLR